MDHIEKRQKRNINNGSIKNLLLLVVHNYKMKENLEYIFEECFKEVTDKDTLVQKDTLKEKFTRTIIGDDSLDELNMVIRLVALFKDAKGFAREKFLALCAENDYLSRELLTAVYLSVHTYASPTQYFSRNELEEIFEKINTPFTCFESRDKITLLEESFLVYRGLREKPLDIEDCGFCWSLSEAVAINFATVNGKIPGYVISGLVEKTSIKGYVTCRDEQEIIVSAKNVFDKNCYKVD